MSYVKLYRTPTYRSWESMRQRCNNKNATMYHRYGGRGISVCPRWNSFANFLEDMGERPSGATLDRVDNDAGYRKENCKWSTRKEQADNRADRFEVVPGLSAGDFARQVGINSGTVWQQLKQGFCGWPRRSKRASSL